MTIQSKAARHQRIIETLAKRNVQTQDELREALQAAGFDVTQATLSRDLDELNAVKINGVTGSYYAIVEPRDVSRLAQMTLDADVAQRFARVAAEVVTGVDSAMNIVVIHTRPGAAHYLAGALDRNAMPNVVGSVAGDDTVLVVTPDIETASQTCNYIRELIIERSQRKGSK